MNFRKSSKRPLTPPPSFSENHVAIFSEIYDRSIVYNGKNLQYKFLDWKWPPPPSELFGGRLPLPGKCEYLPDRHFRPIWYLLVRHTPSTRIIILPNKCASLGQWHFRPTWNLLVRHTPSKRIAIFKGSFLALTWVQSLFIAISCA